MSVCGSKKTDATRRDVGLRRRSIAASIVYEDREIIIVDKSADLLTVPTDGREPHTLIYRVNEHVRHEGRGRGAFLVHRLDRGVSGLLVFGKTREMADAVQSQFQQRKPERQYDAIVTGHVVQQEGEFRTFLATGKNLNRFSTEDEEEGELAVTHYRVVKNFPRTVQCPAVTHVAVRLGKPVAATRFVCTSPKPDTRFLATAVIAHLWKEIPWPHKRLAHACVNTGVCASCVLRDVAFRVPASIRVHSFLFATFSRHQSQNVDNDVVVSPYAPLA